MNRPGDVIAVDWSGAAQGAAATQHIWLAHVRAGQLVELCNGRHRAEVVDDLVARRHSCRQGLVVGLDFSFSFPDWFVRHHGCRTADDVWNLARREGEGWLSGCEPPFWGRRGLGRPELPEHLRRAERRATVGGIGAKSIFQIAGPGTVGTGSLRGMPHLPRLREAGFGVWPFHAPSKWTVVEIYPRLLTGPVRKSNRAHRVRYLHDAPWRVPATFADQMVDSADAFDAGISALVMGRHAAHLAALVPATDPVTLREGDVWRPPSSIGSCIGSDIGSEHELGASARSIGS